MIKINFEYDTKYGVYRDAIHLPNDHTYTEEEINKIKLERVNAWIEIIENPPTPEPEIVQFDGVNYEKVEIDGQLFLKPLEV
jgi:hypothetical protein